jgi:hypothetical protein
VTPPPGVTAGMVACAITSSHLRLGLRGNPPLLDHDFFSLVVQDDSTWSMDGGEVEISLQKMRKAETWEAALKGHGALNPIEVSEAQKKLTLERFQQEHPGFDFSGAEFSGAPPDPRSFMGGVKY